MLSEKDKEFIVYWEKERDKRRGVISRILNGLPMAILFSLPIILLIFVVYIFFPEWYTRISNGIGSAAEAIVLAIFLCVIFFSYFRMQYKWEMNEQLFQELKSKESVKKQPEENVSGDKTVD